MGKNLYEYDLHTTEGLPYALYFLDISAYSGEKVPLHWHREFEITLVTKGRVKAFVDDVEMILEKGEGLFVNSEMFHGYTKIENEESEFLTAVFDASFITGSESENFLFCNAGEIVIKGAAVDNILSCLFNVCRVVNDYGGIARARANRLGIHGARRDLLRRHRPRRHALRRHRAHRHRAHRHRAHCHGACPRQRLRLRPRGLSVKQFA